MPKIEVVKVDFDSDLSIRKRPEPHPVPGKYPNGADRLWNDYKLTTNPTQNDLSRSQRKFYVNLRKFYVNYYVNLRKLYVNLRKFF